MKMPDLATTGSDIRLVRWLAQPGEAVKRGQPLLEIETDKAVSTVESSIAGVLTEVSIRPDALVSAGQVIALFEMAGAMPAVGAPPTALAPPATPAAAPRSVPTPAPLPEPRPSAQTPAAPALDPS